MSRLKGTSEFDKTSGMTDQGISEDPSEIDAFFAAHLADDEPPRAEGLPPHEVSPLQGKLLLLLARSVRARRVLEIGTLGGYAALWLARAVGRDGEVVTLEIDAGRVALARETVAADGWSDVVEVVAGDALETLPTLTGPFDLVFVDADKRRNPELLPHVLRLVRPGSLIVFDNVVRHDVRRLTEMIAAEPRLEATAVQTVGVKGHDGFLLALVQD